jgi:Zn-dependent M16 (insulinase) family peptidase
MNHYHVRETVRAKNGAYGVFSSMNAWDGTFAFISYRDPNLDKTLDAYDQAAISIRNDVDSGVITDDVISTAIIGAIGDIDGKSYSPSEIGWRSMIYWLSGASAQYRQKIRREVLETKKTDFASFADRLGRMSDSTIAVVSSDSIITSASDRNFTIIQMSL